MSEMPLAYGCEQRRARKTHKCCECGGTIPPNELYFYHHGVWDCQGQSFKVCTDCEMLRIEINSKVEEVDDLISFQELYEHVFASDNPEYIKRFMYTKRVRHAKLPEWMLKREAEYFSQESLCYDI